MQLVKCFKKDGTKRRIKQTLVKHIIHQQVILKHHTKKSNKKIKNVLWKIGLLGFSSKKFSFFK
jgi:hypothetical protein